MKNMLMTLKQAYNCFMYFSVFWFSFISECATNGLKTNQVSRSHQTYCHPSLRKYER